MESIYDRDIINILYAMRGQGVRLKSLARQVYNLHADLFVTDLDYEELRDEIGRYLWHQSRRPTSPFCRLGYGMYALKADYSLQLDLFLDAQMKEEAKAEKQDETPEPPNNHVQLELF